MAKLNLERAIQKGYKEISKNDRHALVVSQIQELANRSLFDAICDSFAVGYYQGVKAAKKMNGGTSK